MLLGSLACGFEPPARDDYELYAALLSQVPDRKERLLIGQETIGAPDSASLMSCPNVTADIKESLTSVLRANIGLRRSPLTLEHQIPTERPYALLTTDQTDTWRRLRFQPHLPLDGRPADAPDPFPESHLITLGDILYNGDRSVALVYSVDTCGSLCGTSGWHLFRRQRERWNSVPGLDCGAVH